MHKYLAKTRWKHIYKYVAIGGATPKRIHVNMHVGSCESPRAGDAYNDRVLQKKACPTPEWRAQNLAYTVRCT